MATQRLWTGPRRTALALLLGLLGASHSAAAHGPRRAVCERGQTTARFATFNISFNRFNEGDLASELSAPGSSQPAAVAEIIQRTRPDVILLNEFDYDSSGAGIAGFQANYLAVSQNGAEPIEYPYAFSAPVNTGVPSSLDLNNDGAVGGPDDAFGFGFFPGQYGMVVLSRFPIEREHVRTFQNFLWQDMPGALLPDDPSTPEPADWYSEDELAAFRLSSKSHWDVPVRVGRELIHVLASHPTPPVFDGEEDRNGTRNHDEIRFWADYIAPFRGHYIYDDEGHRGGLRPFAKFVIMGDLNADPEDGDSTANAARLLTDNPRINRRMTPASEGAVDAAARQGGLNDDHVGDPAFDTGDFNDAGPGNLRVDYVLPARHMRIIDSGVFWPESDDALFPLVGDYPFPSSDHRLVWIDLRVRPF